MMCMGAQYTVVPPRYQSDFTATAIQRGSDNSLTAAPENASRYVDS